MSKIYSQATDKYINVERVIDQISGDDPGPTLIFTGGIHGNEPSGVFALYQVMKELREKQIPVNGSIYALSGNLWALERGERFHEQDLNRLWEHDSVDALEAGTLEDRNNDVIEQKDI